MDGLTFDALVQRLTQARLTRGALLRGVAASAVGGVTGATRAEAIAQPKPKVTLCHEGRTIEIPEAAVPGHRKHGDTLGPCDTPTTTTTAAPDPCTGVENGTPCGGEGSGLRCCNGVCPSPTCLSATDDESSCCADVADCEARCCTGGAAEGCGVCSSGVCCSGSDAGPCGRDSDCASGECLCSTCTPRT
jgi:hypothetical protein